MLSINVIDASCLRRIPQSRFNTEKTEIKIQDNQKEHTAAAKIQKVHVFFLGQYNK
jgi:hypothetical protein